MPDRAHTRRGQYVDKHVDIVRNDPENGRQCRIGVVHGGDVAEVTWLDDKARDDLVPTVLVDRYTGHRVPRTDAAEFMDLLVDEIHDRRVFASRIHGDGECPFRHSNTRAFQTGVLKAIDYTDEDLARR
jgi:hypothetical protein